MIKYLFCILLLLFTFRSLCATNDTKTCRIVMKDGGVLYGCLVIPTSAQSLKKKTLVIVVPSPLRTGEDYEFLSDSLTAKGIALFIYENRLNLAMSPDLPKPGLIPTNKVKPKYSFRDIASDVVEIYHYLRSQQRLRKYKIGFLGHSEGGMSSLVASSMVSPDFLVEIATPTVSGNDFIYSQNTFLTPGKFELLKQIFNLSEKELSVLNYYSEKLITKDSLDYEKYQKKMMDKVGLVIRDDNRKEMLKYYICAQWTLRNNHDMAILNLNPYEYYRKVECPVLFVACARDEMTYSLRDITNLEKIMYKENKQFYTALINTTHSFLKYPSYLMHHTLGDFENDKENSKEWESVGQVVNLITSWMNTIF